MHLDSETPLHQYRNGGTDVSLFRDGTKIRTVFDPDLPPVFPEQMDLKITDWCDAGCAFCHENSTRRGVHGNVVAMLDLLSGLPSGVEIAIGGGDPMSHPEIETLLSGLKEIGLVANITVNVRHIARHQDRLWELIKTKRIYGLGVSFFEDFPRFNYDNLVDHMICGVDDPERLLDTAGRKILVLGYKAWGRGEAYKRKKNAMVERCIAAWFRLLPLIAERHHLSFDNLAISQLNPARLFRKSEDYQTRYMGREGAYSLYVDGVKQTYATSSYASDIKPWSDICAMFADVRDRDHVGF